MQSDEPTRCFWTYRLGPYISPWHWPDAESARWAAQCMPDPEQDPPEVYQAHGTRCTCPVAEQIEEME